MSPPWYVHRYSDELKLDWHCFVDPERLIDKDTQTTMVYMKEIVSSAQQYPSWNDDMTERRFNYINGRGDSVVTNFAGNTAITWMPNKHRVAILRERSPPAQCSRDIVGHYMRQVGHDYDGGESDSRGYVNFGCSRSQRRRKIDLHVGSFGRFDE